MSEFSCVRTQEHVHKRPGAAPFRNYPWSPDIVYSFATVGHPVGHSILAEDECYHQKIPRLRLSSLGEGGLCDTEGESFPGPCCTDPVPPGCLNQEDAIVVLSLAGETLCTLDASAKRLTTRELKFRIKDVAGVFVDHQELVKGDESLPDCPVEETRPLLGVSGRVILTLIRIEPLPTFRALI